AVDDVAAEIHAASLQRPAERGRPRSRFVGAEGGLGRLQLRHRLLPAGHELLELVLRGLVVAEQLVAARGVVVDGRVRELGRAGLLLGLERADPLLELRDLLLERAEPGAALLARLGLAALAELVVVARGRGGLRRGGLRRHGAARIAPGR